MKISQKLLEQVIQKTYDSLTSNHFATLGKPDHPMWDAPFYGVSMGDDPLYGFLKEHIGDFHMSPLEAFQAVYPDQSNPSALRVLSICFPQTPETKETQTRETVCPSREWMVSRGEWEPMAQEFLEKLSAAFQEIGVACVPVDLLPDLKVVREGELGLCSTWSQRHAAYISGLGTFGLSDGLITQRGKAVRFSTVIIEADVEVPPRPYTSHTEWCLFYRDGSCGNCIGRCPAGAISEAGHDKDACEGYEDIFVGRYWPEDIDRSHYKVGCGLCQAGIPCQDGRPGES